ncbi:MAG: trigger factor [Eubacterium sp.]|nr:trigger factor [Eubacterium sp.]
MNMNKKTVMTITAAAALSFSLLTGCEMSDITEKFVGVASGSSASAEGVSTELPEYVSGQAVVIEQYDATQLVELAQYKGVEVDCTVTDDEIQGDIDTLLEQHPKQVKEGTAENGMTVNIDYTGKLNGKKFDGGEAKGTIITLGESGMIPGFDDGIIGMKVGETRDVDLTFPEDYHDEDIAGKKTVFTMKLNYIEEEAEFNDEFVKENTDYKTVAEYKEATRKQLSETKESGAAATAMDTVIRDSKVSSVPPTLVLAEKEMMRAQMNNQMAMYGMTLEDAIAQQGMTMEQFEQNLEDNGRTMGESELIMEAIAIKENIDFSETAVDAYIDEMLKKNAEASGNGEEMTLDKLNENYTNFYGSAMPFERYMRSSLIYSKVSELVGKEAKIIK